MRGAQSSRFARVPPSVCVAPNEANAWDQIPTEIVRQGKESNNGEELAVDCSYLADHPEPISNSHEHEACKPWTVPPRKNQSSYTRPPHDL